MLIENTIDSYTLIITEPNKFNSHASERPSEAFCHKNVIEFNFIVVIELLLNNRSLSAY